jgi:probable addiction module antidote protein
MNEMQIKTRPFDPAVYLDSDETIAAYLTEALDTNDPGFIADALGVIARARGMTRVARDAGLSRESLYRTLSQEGNPELGTLLRVLAVLGLQLSVRPLRSSNAKAKQVHRSPASNA